MGWLKKIARVMAGQRAGGLEPEIGWPFYRSSSGTAGDSRTVANESDTVVGSIRKVSEVVLLLDAFLRTREARTSIAEAKKF